MKLTNKNRVQKKLAIAIDNWKFLLSELNTTKGSMSDLVNHIIDVFKRMKRGDL